VTSPRTQHLADDLAALQKILPLFEPALRRLVDARPSALKGTPYDGPGGINGGLSTSSTEALVIAGDFTATDRRQLDDALRQLSRVTTTIDRIVNAWTPHAPTDKHRAEVDAVNEPECELHRKHADAHEHAHRTGDVSGNLDTTLTLCRWCYDFVRRNGRTPTELEVRRNHDGLTVRVSA
jgi:hypothetical protein